LEQSLHTFGRLQLVFAAFIRRYHAHNACLYLQTNLLLDIVAPEGSSRRKGFQALALLAENASRSVPDDYKRLHHAGENSAQIVTRPGTWGDLYLGVVVVLCLFAALQRAQECCTISRVQTTTCLAPPTADIPWDRIHESLKRGRLGDVRRTDKTILYPKGLRSGTMLQLASTWKVRATAL
jgi:hypothetical protein